MSTKNEAKTETKATEKEAKAETLVYVGPTIPGVASHSTIYNNGLPKELTDAQEKEPAFKALVVPLSALTNALGEINGKTGATYVFYKKALGYKA